MNSMIDKLKSMITPDNVIGLNSHIDGLDENSISGIINICSNNENDINLLQQWNIDALQMLLSATANEIINLAQQFAISKLYANSNNKGILRLRKTPIIS